MKLSKLFGLHSVQAALSYSPKKITKAWVDSGRQDKRLTQLVDELADLEIETEKTDRKKLDRFAEGNNHQGIAYVSHAGPIFFRATVGVGVSGRARCRIWAFITMPVQRCHGTDARLRGPQ